MNKIFPKESLLEEARKFAQKGGIALRLAMEAVHHGLDLPLEKGCKLEASLAGLSWATEDAKEGTEAFLEKRKPIFKDRQRGKDERCCDCECDEDTHWRFRYEFEFRC